LSISQANSSIGKFRAWYIQQLVYSSTLNIIFLFRWQGKRTGWHNHAGLFTYKVVLAFVLRRSEAATSLAFSLLHLGRAGGGRYAHCCTCPNTSCRVEVTAGMHANYENRASDRCPNSRQAHSLYNTLIRIEFCWLVLAISQAHITYCICLRC
jgi:hypothetical protein